MYIMVVGKSPVMIVLSCDPIIRVCVCVRFHDSAGRSLAAG